MLTVKISVRRNKFGEVNVNSNMEDLQKMLMEDERLYVYIGFLLLYLPPRW